MGKTRIIIQAVSGTHSCLDTIFLDIVAPHASRLDQHSYTLGSGSYTDLSFIPKGYSGSYQAVVTLSTLPESGFERRLEYLLQYPHGCVEQTTYTAFPQLYLSSVMDLNDSTQKQCGNHIQKAIERLASFQTVTGGFAYWPGSNYEDAYASCYVGEFLSEAEKKVYPVTPYMKNRLLSYLTERSNASGVEGDVVIAYRLYVLANWNQPNMGAMNRMKEGGGYSLDARVYLAKAYAQCQQMNLVEQLLGGLSKKNFQTNENYFQTAFTQEVEWLDVLRLCGDSRAESQMKYIIQLNNRTAQLNTKECATFLKSYCQFYSQATDKTIHIRYTMNGKTVELNSGKKLYRLKIRGERIHLENKGDELYVNGEEQYVPDTESEAVASKELFLKVTYWGMDGKPMDIKQLYQGTDVRVRIEMENKTEYTMDYMSLQYTLSPGWQMLRVEDESEDNRQSHRHIGDYFYRYYFQLPSHQKRQTTFVVNATYKGKYILPKVWVESMYQAKLRSESPAVPLSVVEQK